MISGPLVSYVLTAAFRDKLVITLILMILLGSSMAVFLGSASMTEQQTFSVVFGSGGLRFLGVLGLVLFISFYVRRAFDNKEVEFLLSRPISKTKYLISHAFAFIVLSAIVAAAVILAVFVLGKPDMYGLFVWGWSILIEFMLISCLALFFSMVLSSAAGSALACLGFYALARMVGTLLGIADVPGDGFIMSILGSFLEFISIIIPRLDLMGQTSWLVYGVDGMSSVEYSKNTGDFIIDAVASLGLPIFVFLQGFVFITLTIICANFDLIRRQF